MSLSELVTSDQQERVASRLGTIHRWRFPLLCGLLLLALGYNTFLALVAPPPDVNAQDTLFVWLWLISFIPYLAASILILATRGPEGRKRWLELAVILGCALVLRGELMFIPPNLSRDSWRYLWDARVTLSGYSPYAYAPNSPVLAHLVNILYVNSRFRNVPTIYPPGAQAFYLFSYLLAPNNLVFLKGIFIIGELITTAGLAVLLAKKGLDPARCIIYGLCPLPIVEFAIEGHVDALVAMFMVLTLVCAQSQRRGARVLTGFFLAMATLTKLYPILMLAVVWRRRDWAMLSTCLLTIVLAYIPYIILGHGQIFGFFASYASEQNATNAGSVTMWMYALSRSFGLPLFVTYLVDAALVGGGTILVWYWRQYERISMEEAMLVLIGLVFLVSTHIFPWYTTALLPWVALLIGPPLSARFTWHGRALVALFTWYFICLSIVSYLAQLLNWWNWYYGIVYDVTLLGLVCVFVMSRLHRKWIGRKINYVR
jgi:hypothetical protein